MPCNAANSSRGNRATSSSDSSPALSSARRAGAARPDGKAVTSSPRSAGASPSPTGVPRPAADRCFGRIPRTAACHPRAPPARSSVIRPGDVAVERLGDLRNRFRHRAHTPSWLNFASADTSTGSGTCISCSRLGSEDRARSGNSSGTTKRYPPGTADQPRIRRWVAAWIGLWKSSSSP
jgi:hypothetical protein